MEQNPDFEETKSKMPSCMDGMALAVKPKRGSAILFYNQLHDGKLDINSTNFDIPSNKKSLLAL